MSLSSLKTDELDSSQLNLEKKDNSVSISIKQLLGDIDCSFHRLTQNAHHQICSLQSTMDSPGSIFRLNDCILVNENSSDESSSDTDRRSKKKHLCLKSLLRKWSKKQNVLQWNKQQHSMLCGKVVESIFFMDIWRIKSKHMFSEIDTGDMPGNYKSRNIRESGNNKKLTTYLQTRCHAPSRVVLTGESFTIFFFPKIPIFKKLFIFRREDLFATNFSTSDKITKDTKSCSSVSGGPPSCKTELDCLKTCGKGITTQYVCKELQLHKENAVPDLKQDSKDLARDTLRINGQLVSGTIGYQALYQILSRVLLSKENEIKYLDFLEKEAEEDDNRVAAPSMCFDNLENDTESLVDVFCRAELQAILLLHLTNRTLAGGYCFDAVLSSFPNELHNLIVPNSQQARPLEFIIGKDDSTLAAILFCHTPFKIHNITLDAPSTMKQQESPRVTDIHVYFMADVNLTEILSSDCLDMLCWLMRYYSHKVNRSTDQLNPFSSPYISLRLESWINTRSSLIQHQKNLDTDVEKMYHEIVSALQVVLPYRVYITHDTSLVKNLEG